MNLTVLASEIASRVPSMAKDSPLNNSFLIQRMIQDELASVRAEDFFLDSDLLHALAALAARLRKELIEDDPERFTNFYMLAKAAEEVAAMLDNDKVYEATPK